MAALEDITNNFEEQLTCSLCLDVFTDPKTLPCLHSFCKRCIAQCYQTSGNPFKKQMMCPMCKTTIVVPDGDPSKLPSSFYIESLLQLLLAMKTKANQPQLLDCVNCEQPQVLVSFCAQCNGLICEACFNAHNSLKVFKRPGNEHQPVMLNQFNEEKVNGFIKSQMLCKKHDNKKLEYYCKTCAICICQICATLDHENHQKQSLEDAAQDSRTLIEGAMNRVKKRKEKDGEELEQSKENMQRIQRETDVAERNVDDIVKLICDMAKEHGRAMKDELRKTLQELKTPNDGEQTAIKTRLEESDEFLQHCQALLEREIAYEEIQGKEMIVERAELLSEAISIFSCHPIQRNVTIRYSVTEQVIQSLQDIGKIVKNVIDPGQSTIESVKKVRPGFINECKIITRNAEGNVCPTRIESIDVKIKDAEGNEVETKVSQEQIGKYSVSFKPQKNGRHEIHVNIGGQRIGNSPLNIDIHNVKELLKPVKTFGERGSGRGQLNFPQSIAVSDNGEIAIADCRNNRIQIFSLDGNYLREFGSQGTKEGQLHLPFGVVFNGERIIVSDGPNDKGRIQEFDLNGAYVRTIYSPKQWIDSYGICVNDEKNIAACCYGKQELGIKPSIKVFSKQGDLVHEFHMPDDNEQPRYITYGNGKYFVSYFDTNFIRVFDLNGVFLYKFGEQGERDGQFDVVRGLAVYGPRMILVCDRENHRVQLFTQEGQFIRSFGSRGSGVGQMNHPVDVAVTPHGRVFVVEYTGSRVSVWV